MEKFKIVIIGAGPAGLRAAEILAKEGQSVLVLEKNQSLGQKVCANGATQKILEFGLPEQIFERKFRDIVIDFKKTKRRLRAPIFTINRQFLCGWLYDSARAAGAEIRLGVECLGFGKNSVLTPAGEIEYKYLIGADGANSIVRKNLGLPAKQIEIGMQYSVGKIFPNLEIIFDPDLFGQGYAWIFPHKDYTFIGCGSGKNYLTAEQLRANLVLFCKNLGLRVSEPKFMAAPLNSDFCGWKFGNIFLAGEASGLVSPLTGEGIWPALVSGEELAKYILDENYGCLKLEGVIAWWKSHLKLIGKFSQNKTLLAGQYFLVSMLLKNKGFRKWLARKI